MAKVSLQKVTRQFDNVTAVRDISFDVPDGEFWVLVGASGCGKSTLLRTVAGLESITSGELYIGDRLVNRVPARQRDVAMVFQNYALYPHMNVAKNLAFGLRMRHQEPKYITQKVREVARSLDIEHLLKRKPKQLSGGQQQRVALGRAIARQPQVFLLDEPLSNLDDRLRTDMRGELQRIHQQFGITTIYVTHDRVEAMTLADKIVVLSNGEVQQIGSPQAVLCQSHQSYRGGVCRQSRDEYSVRNLRWIAANFIRSSIDFTGGRDRAEIRTSNRVDTMWVYDPNILFFQKKLKTGIYSYT